MHETVEAILFDYGMVLSQPRDPNVWDELSRKSGMPEPQLEATYWQFRDAYDSGHLTGEQFWQSIGATIGRSYSDDELRELNDADVRLWGGLNTPMVDWVERLHRAGIKTGILSNMGDRMAEGLTARYDWIGNFHHTVWSHQLKMRKPDPAIYAAAEVGLGVPRRHILFIDDKQENTAAAEHFGMQAIVYRDHDSFLRDMQQRNLGSLLSI